MQNLPDFELEVEDAASPSPQRSIEGARTISRCTVQSNLPDDRRYVSRRKLSFAHCLTVHAGPHRICLNLICSHLQAAQDAGISKVWRQRTD